MTNTLVFYHDHCRDGLTAAAIAKMFLGDNAICVGLEHSQFPDLLKKERNNVFGVNFNDFDCIYFLDIAPPPLVLGHFLNTIDHNDVYVIDHHESALNELKEFIANTENPKLYDYLISRYSFEMDRSGAGLAWEYFSQSGCIELDEYPPMVKYVQDRDLWNWNFGDETKAFSAYLSMVRMDVPTYMSLLMISCNDKYLQQIIDLGMPLVEQERNYTGRMASTPRRNKLQLGEHEFIAVNASVLQSEIGNYLADRYPGVCVWYCDSKGNVRMSLRSSENNPNAIKVNDVAVEYGGGGHPNAAGCAMPIQDFLDKITFEG